MDCRVNVLLKTMNHQVKKIEAIYYKLASNLDMPESEFWIRQASDAVIDAEAALRSRKLTNS